MPCPVLIWDMPHGCHSLSPHARHLARRRAALIWILVLCAAQMCVARTGNVAIGLGVCYGVFGTEIGSMVRAGRIKWERRNGRWLVAGDLGGDDLVILAADRGAESYLPCHVRHLDR
eukprot:3549288-Rhodomonas_salina.2